MAKPVNRTSKLQNMVSTFKIGNIVPQIVDFHTNWMDYTIPALAIWLPALRTSNPTLTQICNWHIRTDSALLLLLVLTPFITSMVLWWTVAPYKRNSVLFNALLSISERLRRNNISLVIVAMTGSIIDLAIQTTQQSLFYQRQNLDSVQGWSFFDVGCRGWF